MSHALVRHAILARVTPLTGDGGEAGVSMAARCYCADSENGGHLEDPSQDALSMLISDLNDSDNTFVVVQPDQDDPVWFASVAVLEDGGYEVVRRDTERDEHEVTIGTSIDRIAKDLTVWMAARGISRL